MATEEVIKKAMTLSSTGKETAKKYREALAREEAQRNRAGEMPTLPVEKLKDNPKNCFTVKEDEAFEILRDSIRENGIMTPIMCYEDESDLGNYIIISGHRRTAIAREEKIAQVPVRVVKPFGNEFLELEALGKENFALRKLEPMDIAQFYTDYIKACEQANIKGRKRDLIAEALNKQISSRTLYNYQFLLQLPDKLQEWVREEWLSPGRGKDLVILMETKSKEVMEKIEKGEKEFPDGPDKKHCMALVGKILDEYKTSSNKHQILATKDVARIEQITEKILIVPPDTEKQNELKSKIVNITQKLNEWLAMLDSDK